MAGGHGHLLEAVNITMVSSTVFEARQDVSAPPAPAPADAVEAKEGTAESRRGPQQPEQKEVKKQLEKQPERPAPAEVVEAPSVVKPPQEEKERKAASTAADVFGGAAARGEAVRPEQKSAPAAASPGVVRAYANAVAEALDRTKPKRVPAYGSVKVKLVVSTDGELASLEILKSSGNRRLDDAILASVRRTKLPVPPPSLSLKERWFERTYRYVPG
jgi:protein TonB